MKYLTVVKWKCGRVAGGIFPTPKAAEDFQVRMETNYDFVGVTTGVEESYTRPISEEEIKKLEAIDEHSENV